MTIRFKIILLIAVVISFSSVFLDTKSAHAIDQGNLISDNVFANEGAMSEVQISSFINAFPKSCLNPANYPAGLSSVTWQEPLGYSSYGGSVSPSRVIWKAATIYHINPQVILATLEKEQNLVTGNAGCNVKRYNSAMGYNCPDGSENALKNYPDIGIYGTCVAQASNAGFARQVNHAAWQLIFDMHRAYGDLDWGGDNSVYYYGRMTAGWRSRIQGGASSYYDGYTSIDGQAIYLANGATASLYNYTPHFNNFRTIFTQWFGDSYGPAAYKSASSSTIYTTIFGYKMSVPYMAVLNDYGISSDSVRTVDQSYIDSIPSAQNGSGISSEIAHVVKSPDDGDEDGGSIYLISVGKRYQFKTLQQLFDFGFQETDIRYLPLPYILNIPSGGALSDFVTSPQGAIFQMNGAQKRLIFEYSSYISRNPADIVSPLSYYLIDKLASGSPIADRPVLVKRATGDEVLLYNGTDYYTIPDFDTFQCWGFSGTLQTPIYRLLSNTYTSTISPTPTPLSCINNVSGTNYVLLSGLSLTIPAANTPTSIAALPPALTSFYQTHPSSRSLSNYIKTSDSAAVWVLNGSKRRIIPTYNTFVGMGLASSNIDTVPNSVLLSYTEDGINLYPGQLVKEPSSAEVYIVDNGKRYTINSSDLFNSYRFSWSKIETIALADLNANYPINGTLSPFLVDTTLTKVYLVATNGCYTVDDSVLAGYGTSYSTLAAAQSYSRNSFSSSLTTQCVTGNAYVKASNSSLVYKMIGGQKRPINSYPTLLTSNGGREPSVAIVDPVYLSTLPTGPSL